jgi:type II restriction/modification system DNA methylase subunit YeeA
MTPREFIQKWRRVQLTERSASQQHFLDLCDLLAHPKPAAEDPEGESFTFEKGAHKQAGGEGFADVWKRGCFGWEYKGKHKNLDAAYDQLLQYREALENPPLLVVCDLDRIVVHTNFTGTASRLHEISLDSLDTPQALDLLRAVFLDPERLKPGATSAAITAEVASRLADLAGGLRGRGVEPESVARFLDRIVFCLFAEDIGLLPPRLFSQIVEKSGREPVRFARLVGQLFEAMAQGSDFGLDRIRHFNGDLFADGDVIELTVKEIDAVHEATSLDWSAVDPSIFGTLFERGLDPAKRSQLGAHYTSRADIETLVEPVVMAPLRREWGELRATLEALLRTGRKRPGAAVKALSKEAAKKARSEVDVLVNRLLHRLASVKVLDPACGSGNFLYVTLQKLKDLEKEVIVWAMDHGFSAYLPRVGPWQLHGIESNRYAFELAQMTVWIGYLQWTRDNGFGWLDDPLLRHMNSFQSRDAILDLADPENPGEPEWPRVDFIVGNPPFLGGKRMRSELGDDYVERLFALWKGRVPAEADYCCYWFEKARRHIETGKAVRAGLLATQGIRGGASREVLKRIKETGDIFFAESDREWILDGAAVHVSMVGFDAGGDRGRSLDGKSVATIHADLSSAADVTLAVALPENRGISFMGDTKGGAFDIEEAQALEMLRAPNPHGAPNSDVVVPWVNGLDIGGQPRRMFIVDFGTNLNEREASPFERPFEYVRSRVLPERKQNNRDLYRTFWWRHVEARPGMRRALGSLDRFIATVRHSKFRVFVWMRSPTLPDSALIAIAHQDDLFLGLVHSRAHEVWARSQGTQVRERESGFRYTPTSCFETFAFPRSGADHEPAIADAARELVALRDRWLNPPEWTQEEILEFPGRAAGPWGRFVHDPDKNGLGTVRYPRAVPKDADCATKLAKRTLTNLYNERPAWLDLAHRKLDEAVFAAYGWEASISDEEILTRLLKLNLERATGG